MAPVHPGYIPDGYDAADARYIYLGDPKKQNDTRAANLLATAPEAFESDPAPVGSCVVDAVVAATRFLAFRTSHAKLPARPSRRFLYYNSRALTLMDREGGDPTQWPDAVEDKGVQIRHATRAVSVFGAAAEETFPWVEQELRGGAGGAVLGLNDRPLHVSYSEAAAGPAVECNRLDALPPPAHLDNLDKEALKAYGTATLSSVRLCLTEGYPVIFAFRFFWSTFPTVPPSSTGADEGYPIIASIPAGRRLLGPDPATNFRTHVGLIIGFDQEKRRVLVKGVWPGEGQPSSPPPYFWMSYEWITDVRATMDFWMLRESAKSARRTMKSPSYADFFEREGGGPLPSIDRKSGALQNPSMVSTSTISTCCRESGSIQGFSYHHAIDMVWVANNGAVERDIQLDQVVAGTFHSTHNRDEISGAGSAAPGGVVILAQDVRRDVFWIGRDGSVQQAYSHTPLENPNSAWSYATVANAGSAQPGAGIAATLPLWGGTDHFYVYWVGPQGSIESANSVVQPNAWTRRQIAGPGSAASLSNLAAAGWNWGCPNNTGIGGVWWITPDGMVRGAGGAHYLDHTQQWAQNWAQKEAELPPTTAALGSRLAACSFGTDDENCFQVLYTTPAGTIRVRRYGAEVSDREAYDGNLARIDTGIQLWPWGAVWVNPNNALMTAAVHQAARPLSKPGCIMPGTPLGVADPKPYGGFVVGFLGHDGGWASATWQ
jgi:hypothetical protein